MAQYQLVTCTINGKKSEKMVDVRASLTDMLRNDYRLTSVKKGCEVGECGACTALINGEAINTCLYLAVWAEGKDIITLEGLMNPDGTLSDVQKAFMEETSIQCGFCIPGFILTATEIVNSGKEYTDDELRKLLSGHLCRCTAYPTMRMHNYFRADVSYNMERRKRNGVRNWQFSIINTTWHKNPVSIYPYRGSYKATVLIPIMPSVSHTRTFGK